MMLTPMMLTPMMLLAWTTGLWTHYEARVPTFGCNSSAEVAQLQRVRSDSAAVQKLLYAQVAYGQCILIERGAEVQGTVDTADSAVLRIEARIDPPGYMAPASDFRPRQTGAAK